MLPATLLLKKPGPPGLFGPPCKRFKYNRYFCKCDATFSRVKPCTFIKSKMRFGTALSMPNWFTALTNCWCSSADQTTRGFFEPPPVFPPDCPAPGVPLACTGTPFISPPPPPPPLRTTFIMFGSVDRDPIC